MAVFPVDAGHGDLYSGVYIPEIWSGKLQEKFYDATVLGAIANTDWEGEIRNQGDKVKIRTVPSLTIRDYKAGLSLTTERPVSANIELLIDQGKYWAAVVDDVMEIQSDIGLMDMWSRDASEQMKIAIDTNVLAYLPANIAAANVGDKAGVKTGFYNLGKAGAPLSITAANILTTIVDMGTVLDEQSIPESGRWLLMNPWVCGLLKKSDLKNASITGDGTSVLRNGRLGEIDRFTLYSSNLLPTVADGGGAGITAFYMLAGHKVGLSFASQVTKVETLRSESTFGNVMRGLNVFGRKVTQGAALTAAYVVKG